MLDIKISRKCFIDVTAYFVYLYEMFFGDSDITMYLI